MIILVGKRNMASFCLAGNVESDNYTLAERLCDILNQTLPVVHIVKYVCLKKTWSAAQEKLCERNNFDINEVSKLQCVVWHEDGRYIGGAAAFADYCKNTYSITSDLKLSTLIQGITKENAVVVEKMFNESSADSILLPAEDGTIATQY